MNAVAMTPYGGGRALRAAGVRHAPPPVLLGPELPGDDGIDFRGLLDILRRRWLTVLIPMLVLGGLSFAYVTFAKKVYTASTLLLLDPRDQRVLQSDVLQAGAGSDAALVESQVRVVTSDNVLIRVVEKLNLANVESFGGDAEAPAERAADALDTLARAVSASRADRTYVLELKAKANDPALARRIADALAAAYIADQIDAVKSATRKTNENVTARLDELRVQLRDADEKVQRYRAANGLVGRDGTAVTEQQLAELNQRLIQARAVLATAQARHDQLSRGNAAATPEALASQAMSGLRTQEAEVARREADLSATYGDNHPAVVKVRAELATIRAQIGAEVGRFSESARNDLAIARGDVAALQAELDRLTGRDVTDAAALIELRELQREADATRTIYEAMLARAKETGAQEDLATASARIIAPAVTPDTPSYPPKLFILGVAIAFGLGLGAALALLMERFDERVRTAGQLRRLGLDVLAALPPFASGRRAEQNGFDYAIRLLRAELRDASERLHQRTALVVGSQQHDGAAAVALNLALAAAASGEKVLIIDADPVNRTLSQLIAPRARIGLAEVLSGKAKLSDALIGNAANGLQALPLAARDVAYRGRPSRIAYEKLIAEAKARFAYIVFVGAPLTDEPDARSIAEATDQVALVLKAEATTRSALAKALRALRVSGDKTCGIVLTMANARAAA